MHGTAKDDCGLLLAGADIVVRQAVGARAGHGMRCGNLILGSDTGPDFGTERYGGHDLFARYAASIAETMREVIDAVIQKPCAWDYCWCEPVSRRPQEFRLYRPRSSSEAEASRADATIHTRRVDLSAGTAG